METFAGDAIEIINELHTERLDYTSEYVPLIDAAQTLEAYENTGLSPEEINSMREKLARYEQAFSVIAVEDFPDEMREILDNYYAKMAMKFIDQKKDALQDLDGWCESYQQDHDLKYTPAEVTAWKAGMRFGDDNAHDYLSDLIESDPTSMWDHER